MAEPASQISVLFSDARVLTALIAGAVSLAVFAGGKIYELLQGRSKRISDEIRLRNAIFTEIMHNREELRFALDNSPPVDFVVRSLEEDEKRTIHAVYIRNMRFFDALIDDLHVLPDDVLEATLRFYHCLEMVYASFDGFQRESFRHMTTRGKRAQIEYLENKILEGITLGDRALSRFGWYFPDLSQRQSHAPGQSPENHGSSP